MSRPSQLTEKRAELLPVVARAFAELGYRRATTAALAERCGVQENILYRLWPDKKAMFLAVIAHVYESSRAAWERVRGRPSPAAAERLLAYEAEHHGEFGLYRIVFAGLSECDDPDIHAALRDMYARYQRFIREQIQASRSRNHAGLDPELAAWALIGLATAASITRELRLLNQADRQNLMNTVGDVLLARPAAERSAR